MRPQATDPVKSVDQEKQAQEQTGAETSVDGAPIARRPRERGAAAAGASTGRRVSIQDLNAFYGNQQAVKGMNIDFSPNEVTAIIGPSGCGKSTMVRCINRMHEEVPGARASGEVRLDDVDIYGNDVDVVSVRRSRGSLARPPRPRRRPAGE